MVSDTGSVLHVNDGTLTLNTASGKTHSVEYLKGAGGTLELADGDSDLITLGFAALSKSALLMILLLTNVLITGRNKFINISVLFSLLSSMVLWAQSIKTTPLFTTIPESEMMPIMVIIITNGIENTLMP